MDPNALQDEISSKCSLNCPDNVDCSSLNGYVLWTYSPDSSVNITNLSYSRENNEFYSYLGHNDWESAIGDSVINIPT